MLDLENYAQKSGYELALSIFNGYPIANRLAEQQKEIYILKAIEEGNRLGVMVKGRFQTTNPLKIAASLGLQVKPMEEGRSDEFCVKFAEYSPKQGVIYVNAKAERQLEEALGINYIREIFVAHELFHYFEAKEIGRICRKIPVEITICKWIKIKYPLVAISEIAANAFVKTLLNLSFEPKVLDEVICDLLEQNSDSRRANR